MAIQMIKFSTVFSFLAGMLLTVVIYCSDVRMLFKQMSHFHCEDHGATNDTATLSSQPFVINQDKIIRIKQELNDSNSSPPAFSDGVHLWKYLMNNEHICSDTDMVDVVIIVHTAPYNVERRQRIRQTYGSRSKFLPFQVRVVFLLGFTYTKTVEEKVKLEHRTYNDTIMGDFTDDYHNLTLKGVMGFRWLNEFCQNSRFVLKIDDDVMVNMYKLLFTFRSLMYNKKKSIFCNTWFKDTMPVLRNDKWKVEPHLFYKRKFFPYDYCSGFLVLFTSDMIQPMYEASKVVPFFWIDDVYLFGMLPSAVGGVTYHNLELGKYLSLSGVEALNCTQTLGTSCPMLASLVGASQFINYWRVIEGIYATQSWNVQSRFVE